MGTRHLTCVVVDGEYKIAQYGQWDGYPSGQGLTVLTFLHIMDREKFLANVRKSRFAEGAELENLWNKARMDEKSVEWRAFTRDTGAEILILMQECGPLTLQSNIEFAGDSLMCEWVYVLDFDKNTFEVYEGFNKTLLKDSSERFKDMPITDSGYFPVRHVKTYNLYELPTEEQFIKELEHDE
jgi:hypothetical protein